MNKKYLLLTLIILFTGLGLIVWYSFRTEPNSKPRGKKNTVDIADNQTVDPKKTDQAESVQSKEPEEIIHEKAEIPFRNYKRFYEKADPEKLIDYDGPEDCRNGVENWRYSYIEFVFLEESEEGTYKPFNTYAIKYEDVNFDSSCGVTGKGAAGTSKHSKTCRIQFPVFKGCKCNDGLKPNKLYKFRGMAGIGRVNYKFKTPRAKNFDFVRPGSGREPEPYRFPILIDEVKKTKAKVQHRQQRNVQKEKITFKHVMTDLRSKMRSIHDLEVFYYLNGENFITDESKKDGTYQLKVPVPADNKTTGGAAAVYGSASSKDPSKVRKYLLMYKPNVQSKTVDMSEGLSYRFDPEKSVRKTIFLDVYDPGFSNKLESKNHHEVLLVKEFEGRENPTHINASPAIKRNGRWTAEFEAPPGKYILTLGNYILDKNFHWPPKN